MSQGPEGEVFCARHAHGRRCQSCQQRPGADGLCRADPGGQCQRTPVTAGVGQALGLVTTQPTTALSRVIPTQFFFFSFVVGQPTPTPAKLPPEPSHRDLPCSNFIFLLSSSGKLFIYFLYLKVRKRFPHWPCILQRFVAARPMPGAWSSIQLSKDPST